MIIIMDDLQRVIKNNFEWHSVKHLIWSTVKLSII